MRAQRLACRRRQVGHGPHQAPKQTNQVDRLLQCDRQEPRVAAAAMASASALGSGLELPDRDLARFTASPSYPDYPLRPVAPNLPPRNGPVRVYPDGIVQAHFASLPVGVRSSALPGTFRC